MRCQGPREGKAGQCFNIVVTSHFEWVQQRHLCQTNDQWLAPAAKSGHLYLNSISVNFHQNSVPGQNLVPSCSVFYSGCVSEV